MIVLIVIAYGVMPPLYHCMKFCLPLLACVTLILLGCGKEPPPAPSAPPPPPAPKKITTGKVELLDAPEGVEPLVEVISVGFIPNRVFEMVTRQQQALDAWLNPQSSTQTGAGNIMSQQDADRVTASINALQSKVPERTTSNVYNDAGEPQPYVSRESLRERYSSLVARLNVANFAETLNEISQKMRDDHELLQKLAAQPGPEGAQAQADINWLAAFSQYMQQYQGLVAQYDEARRKEVLRQNQEIEAMQKMATPEEEFKRVQAEVASTIQVELYKNSDGASYAKEDGSFQVEGHGKLVVRTILDGYSLFFVQDGPGGEHIEFTDLKNSFLDPEQKPAQ